MQTNKALFGTVPKSILFLLPSNYHHNRILSIGTVLRVPEWYPHGLRVNVHDCITVLKEDCIHTQNNDDTDFVYLCYLHLTGTSFLQNHITLLNRLPKN